MRPTPEENIRDLTATHIYTTKESNKPVTYIYVLAEKAAAIFRMTERK